MCAQHDDPSTHDDGVMETYENTVKAAFRGQTHAANPNPRDVIAETLVRMPASAQSEADQAESVVNELAKAGFVIVPLAQHLTAKELAEAHDFTLMSLSAKSLIR
jgi:hypothetical protein